jgi:lipopolysaccharide transport system permease protein
MEKKDELWDTIIVPSSGLLSVNFSEIIKYRDLLFLFVKRDFISFYKQTILGPLWFLIQPLITTITFTIIFSSMAKISTDGLPSILFYLIGITLWNFFSESLTKISTSLRDNSGIFGKVYFPRLITPLSIVASTFLKMSIQIFLMLIFLLYYFFYKNFNGINYFILFYPVIIILLAMQALGLGMIVTALTNKYRDLSFLLTFGIQLYMYATPIIYPMSSVPEKYKILIKLNPLTEIIEIARYGILGKGFYNLYWLIYCALASLVILLLGLLIFNKVQKNFIDTV